MFDRMGLMVLMSVPVLAVPVAPLAFSTSYGAALAGVILWDAVMGTQESIMRAAVAGMIPANGRGTAYGVFNTGYGLFWFAGSALMGVLGTVPVDQPPTRHSDMRTARSVSWSPRSYRLLYLVYQVVRSGQDHSSRSWLVASLSTRFWRNGLT
jgi:hypothetical protein